MSAEAQPVVQTSQDRVVSASPVLIVDDSGYARRRLRRFLNTRGVTEVVEAADGAAALRSYGRCREQGQLPLVLVDQVMRGQAGIETARILLERDPAARIVMLTMVSDPEVHRRALEAGILHVLKKNDWEGLGDVLGTENR
jgi:DNA-binding NarL/FixJ family response regulator